MNVDQKIETPEPEGLDTGASDGWGDYPLDTVFVRTEPRSVVEVLGRIKRKRYVLDPDFQRDFVWSNLKQQTGPDQGTLVCFRLICRSLVQ
jgi:hypothetical protein